MKKLSIKIKVSAFLAITLMVIFAVNLIVNHQFQKDSMSELYKHSVDEVNLAVAENVSFMMRMGSNEDIQPVVERLVENDVMEEISVVNAEKVVSRSSDKSKLGRPATDPMWATLFASGRDTVIETTYNDEPALVKYKVFANNEECADCHDIASEKILGGMKMVKSKQAMEAALAESFNAV